MPSVINIAILVESMAPSRMLKKSASLSCSFGLSGLFGLSGSIKQTRQTRQTRETRQTGLVAHVHTTGVL